MSSKHNGPMTHLLPAGSLHRSQRDSKNYPPHPADLARAGSMSAASSAHDTGRFYGPYPPYKTQGIITYGDYMAGKPYLKRYGAIVEKNGKRRVAKIISLKTLEEWATENGYKIILGGRIFGRISEKYERTEFADE